MRLHFQARRSNMMKQTIAAIFLFAFLAQIDAFRMRARDDVSNDNRHLFPQNCLRGYLYQHQVVCAKNSPFLNSLI